MRRSIPHRVIRYMRSVITVLILLPEAGGRLSHEPVSTGSKETGTCGRMNRWRASAYW
ncbi:hypothetical protein CO2235_MP80245 [Cupriavidus oxalaticus]|uniref:Uncharacterized protein n=1 Tax=Cupriavidus oxalaticus TaxID=96344 RepID=A0A375GPJ4_9BURK|nr:hypothetical protein CO2235_MP80245 [Cupriavidus oxalaticus]